MLEQKQGKEWKIGDSSKKMKKPMRSIVKKCIIVRKGTIRNAIEEQSQERESRRRRRSEEEEEEEEASLAHSADCDTLAAAVHGYALHCAASSWPQQAHAL